MWSPGQKRASGETDLERVGFSFHKGEKNKGTKVLLINARRVNVHHMTWVREGWPTLELVPANFALFSYPYFLHEFSRNMHLCIVEKR
jgi:hypothetical protein